MKKVIVYCGESIQEKCGRQLHPCQEVQNANQLIKSEKDEIAYSNSTDFISAIKYLGLKYNVHTQFFLNGINCNDDIEPIFEDINRAIDMLNELTGI